MSCHRPTVSFKTIGCRLNQAETARIATSFELAGWQIRDAGMPCDVAVINTCTITHSAERDCARWARRLRREGARHVVLAGCAVEFNAEAVKTASHADLVVGQAMKAKLPGLTADQLGILPAPDDCRKDAAMVHSARTRGLIKVQDGCDFRCSYCVVPDTRGKPQSRPLQSILTEIETLVAEGYREITLTGANLGCYQQPPYGLLDLLEHTEQISGLDRIRIGSIETTTVERAIIDFMVTSKKLCHFLHIPLQSGDDHILKQMRRRYTADQYRRTVEYAVDRIPDIGLGTDVITGFPGEVDRSFQNTLGLIRDLPFSNLHVFSYSQRRGTPAEAMPDQVDDAIKKKRTRALIALGKQKKRQFAKRFIGHPVEVLIEKSSPEPTGWTSQYLPVKFTGSHAIEINRLVTCNPTHLAGETLIVE